METNYIVFEVNDNLEFFHKDDVTMVQTIESEVIDCIETYGLSHPITVQASQRLDEKIVSMQKQYNKIKEEGLLDKALAFNRQLDIREVIARVQ